MTLKTMRNLMIILVTALGIMTLAGRCTPAEAMTMPVVLNQGDTPYCLAYAAVAEANASLGNHWTGRDALKIAADWQSWTIQESVTKVLKLKTVSYSGSWSASQALYKGVPVAFVGLPYTSGEGLFWGVWGDENNGTRHNLSGMRISPEEPNHAMVALRISNGYVLVQSSWGTGWGYNGRVWVKLTDWQKDVDATYSYAPAYSITGKA